MKKLQQDKYHLVHILEQGKEQQNLKDLLKPFKISESGHLNPRKEECDFSHSSFYVSQLFSVYLELCFYMA